jgi:hypothetical protein
LRQILEGQLSQLSCEVERLFDEARGRARRELSDQLNQSVRRLRQSGSLDQLAATLLDAAAAFAAGAAIFRIAGPSVQGERIRGVSQEACQVFGSLQIPLRSAPALASAVESRDPVIAVTTAAEVSPDLMSLAAHPADGRAFIFPLVVKDRVPVVLYCWGPAQSAVLEMLAQVASAVWGSLAEREAAELVTVRAAPETPRLGAIAPASASETHGLVSGAVSPTAPAAMAASAEPISAADALSAEEQAIHLRAQRFARVRVAEMRLHEGAAVESGRTERDLYRALGPRIDVARAIFRHSYLALCPNMADYLHVELVRTLAHDDPDLLGKDYPGPLA